MVSRIDEDALLEFLNCFDSVESGQIERLYSARSLLTPHTLLSLLNDVSLSISENIHSSEPTISEVVASFDRFTEGVFRNELSPLLKGDGTPTDYDFLYDTAIILGELLCVTAIDWRGTEPSTSEKFVARILSLSTPHQKAVQQVLENYVTTTTQARVDTDEGAGEAPINRRTSMSSLGRRSSANSQRYGRWQDDDASSVEEIDSLTHKKVTDEVKRLRFEVESLRQRNEQLEKTSQETLQSSQRAMDDQRERELSSQRDRDDTIERLEAEIEAHTKSNKQLRLDFEKFRKEAEAETRSLNDEAELARGDRQKLVAVQEQLDGAKAKLQEKVNEIHRMKSMLQSAEEDKQESITKMFKMQSEMDSINLMKDQLEYYKKKSSELDIVKSSLDGKLEQVEQNLSVFKKRTQELEKQCEILGLEMKAAEARHETKLLELQTVPDNGLTDRGGGEELARLKKENELLRAQVSCQSSTPVERSPDDIKLITQLQDELDVANKTKQLANAKLSSALLENESLKLQLEKGDGESVGQLHSKIAELQSKVQVAETSLKVVDMEKQKDAELASQKLSQLEDIAKAAKNQLDMVENATESKVQKKCDEALSYLKQQLTIREREVGAYKNALTEGLSMQRNELFLMSSALHTLTYRYWVEKSKASRAEAEMSAIKTKLVQKKQKLLASSKHGGVSTDFPSARAGSRLDTSLHTNRLLSVRGDSSQGHSQPGNTNAPTAPTHTQQTETPTDTQRTAEEENA